MENTGRTLASVSFVASVADGDPEDDADVATPRAGASLPSLEWSFS